MPRWILLAAVAAATAGCATTSPRPPAPPGTPPGASTAATEPFRASKAVRWARDSAEHRALFLQAFRAANAHVEAAAASREDGTWAVVVDADETILDNSAYQVEREQQGLGFTRESWRAWTERQEAVPLPGAKAFLARVRALGGRIAIVTNRRVSECPDTEAVLQAHGLVYDVILCRPDDGPGDKNSRFEAVARGTTPAGLPPLEVVAFLGDNIRDFPGQSQALRNQGREAFTDFGARFFVLPNPMYGSWE
jgi:5'-nucleotidase (lipoprotein e(P4) family)